MSFSEFNLSLQIEKSIKESGYIEPTQIQKEVISLVLDKKDIMAKAQTGSGKTASFTLPILDLLSKNKNTTKSKIKALILTPTRELTLQVSSTFKIFSKHLDKKIKIVSVIGGESIGNQLLQIQKGCDVVVATPGRLIDIIKKQQIDLKNLDFFVLDEADKMLDLGFDEELDVILNELPIKRQNLFFSATYSEKISSIVSKITNNPIKIFLDEKKDIVGDIEQKAIRVNHENRSALLRHLISTLKLERVLVFMANKRASDNIANKFRKYGFNADSFHGDLIQEERSFTLKEFKDKKIDILFATDIAARGLHIDDISCVINFDLPRSTQDYVHRVGRTGRAGKSGIAISFITHENIEHFKLIEKRCNIELEHEEIEGFELTGTAPVKQKGQGPIKGKRKSKKDKLREQALKEKKIADFLD